MTSILLNKKAIGSKFEKIALKHLLKKGLKLHTKNYLCRHGEIDLIMQDGMKIIFIEVRYRKNSFYGTPLETIDYRKQLKIKKTAMHFLQKTQLHNSYCRFDAISIDNKNGLNWVKNAFE